jgi:hypothetical protein
MYTAVDARGSHHNTVGRDQIQNVYNINMAIQEQPLPHNSHLTRAGSQGPPHRLEGSSPRAPTPSGSLVDEIDLETLVNPAETRENDGQLEEQEALPQALVALQSPLTYTYRGGGEPCALDWDLWDPPYTATGVLASGGIEGYATKPPVTALYISSWDLLPNQWIVAQNMQGVNVLDVLEAIHEVARTPLTKEEWEGLSRKEKNIITHGYKQRRLEAVDFEMARPGLRNVDCLLQVCLPNNHRIILLIRVPLV